MPRCPASDQQESGRRERIMGSERFAELRSRAMAAAQLYGCEADLQESDQFPLDSPLGVVGLKIVVARRSTSGELKVRECNVRLPRRNLAEAVASIVREAAMALPETDSQCAGARR